MATRQTKEQREQAQWDAFKDTMEALSSVLFNSGCRWKIDGTRGTQSLEINICYTYDSIKYSVGREYLNILPQSRSTGNEPVTQLTTADMKLIKEIQEILVRYNEVTRELN